MKNYHKISLILILVLLTTFVAGQDNYCNFNKSFPISRGTQLRLINKFGDINIITVKEDSIRICSTVSIEQDDSDLLKKNIKLIKINTEKIQDTIYVSTLYDKKFFSDEYRTNRKSFRVDYLIKIPEYIDLNIKNEFGNVSLDELSGTFILRLSQGNLNVKRLIKGNNKPVNTVFADHSKIIIEELNWMSLNVLNCPMVSIDKAQALVITSSTSKINIGDINSLVSFSTSDNYNIRSINNFISESNYSSYEIGKLNLQLKSKTNFGSINISDIAKSLNIIDIVSGQSLISLKQGNDISFSSDMILTGVSVEFPPQKYPGLIRTDNYPTTTIAGITGSDKGTKSQIKIRATGGKVIIQ